MNSFIYVYPCPVNTHCIILTTHTDISQTYRTFCLKINKFSTFNIFNLCLMPECNCISVIGLFNLSNSVSCTSMPRVSILNLPIILFNFPIIAFLSRCYTSPSNLDVFYYRYLITSKNI